MTEPTGYTAVGMVGFTDKGTYSASATYVKNDLVHYGGSIWCCLIDDTTGITPTEGVNWRFWVENSQNGISDIVNILGAKNLLKISMKTASSKGITVTNNGDSSITVSGTATETAYFNITEHDFGDIRFSTEGSADNSNYILSGLPSNNNFYIAYNASTKCVTLAVKPAYGAVDNVTIYPMIRPKNIEDDTWVPYTKTNKELTEEVTQNTSDIQTLTNNIQSVSDKVDVVTYSKLNGRRIVIITDSYGEVTGNFITQMQAVCPELVTGTNFFPFAYGGAGFVSTTGFSWKEKFIDSGDIDTVTTPETITDILVLGGSNDRSADISISDIKTAAHTFYDSLVAKFPNAVIYVGYIGYSVNYLAGNYAPSVKQAYQECGFYGYRPIAHANSWLHYTGYITDNVHPNPNGSKLIANGVLNVLLGGGEDDVFNNRPTNVPVTMETGFVSANLSQRLLSYHYGHRSALKVIPSTFMFNSASLLFNGTWQKFATIGDTFLYGANDNYHSRVGAINFSYNSKEYCIPALFKLFNNGLYIQCYPNDVLNGSTAFSLTYVQVLLDGFEADDIFM